MTFAIADSMFNVHETNLTQSACIYSTNRSKPLKTADIFLAHGSAPSHTPIMRNFPSLRTSRGHENPDELSREPFLGLIYIYRCRNHLYHSESGELGTIQRSNASTFLARAGKLSVIVPGVPKLSVTMRKTCCAGGRIP